MARRTGDAISNAADLLEHDMSIDRAISGMPLADERASRFADQGAHDLAPTYYFMLDELFGHCTFDDQSHLLDVGCGMGRVLAYYVHAGLPGRATGIELDPYPAEAATSWVSRYSNLAVIQGNALDLDLTPFTHFYLFNPFAPNVLQQFIETLEFQMGHPCTIIHMSDNGDTWHYVGRPGWTEEASGRIQHYRNARGYQVKIYDSPQHYTIWRYEGNQFA